MFIRYPKRPSIALASQIISVVAPVGIIGEPTSMDIDSTDMDTDLGIVD